ncbi:hypothetical protein V490_07780 [Pseudogymnoascus sp. VKM F-3557]|nr:hypothetical protein V490_07780 [Pseudogymnoascus sp. VKM F-3557]
MQPPPSPAFSVGSTFLNSASAATSMKPTVVRVNKADKPKSTAESSSEGESPAGEASRESAAITVIDDTPTVEQGPFSDPSSPTVSTPPRTGKGHVKKGSLSAVIEEATKKKSEADAAAKEEAKKKDETPFGDEHATD